jgi:hypothetical protein
LSKEKQKYITKLISITPEMLTEINAAADLLELKSANKWIRLALRCQLNFERKRKKTLMACNENAMSEISSMQALLTQ